MAGERQRDWNEGSVDCVFFNPVPDRLGRVSERLRCLAAGRVKPQQFIQVPGRLQIKVEKWDKSKDILGISTWERDEVKRYLRLVP